MFAELIVKNRSCRRFHQDQPVSGGTLEALVDLARLSASAANLQPLRFILSSDPEKNRQIFSCLGWAGYLSDWPGPCDGEQPAAYIIILADTAISRYFQIDCGIAAQSMLLGARDLGLAGCMIANIKRKKLRGLLDISGPLKIPLVLAIGHPRESVKIDPMGPAGSVAYWRDTEGVHHVPKRSLSDLILVTYNRNKEMILTDVIS